MLILRDEGFDFIEYYVCQIKILSI